MFKSFQQFINEDNTDSNRFIEETVGSLIAKIHKFNKVSTQYHTFSEEEFTKPYRFTLQLNLKKIPSLNIVQDSHFQDLPWEKINFKEKGYAINANTYIDDADYLIPKIEIYIAVDLDKEPELYTKLKARLIDILTHELIHVTQMGVSHAPFAANPSPKTQRKSAQKNYQYFLLKDEIESMVGGIYARAKYTKIAMDDAIVDYLQPFLKSDYITKSQYDEVMTLWIKYALERYPDANFSKKVEKIVNSI